MPIKPVKLYWDACVSLSLIEGTPSRIPVIQSILDECDKGDVEIYTSALSIAEVAFTKSEKDDRLLDESTEKKIDTLWQPSSPFKLVDAYASLMYDAKSLMRRVHGSDGWSLKPADAIHLVTAERVGADICQTYDGRWYRFSDCLNLRIEAPKSDSIQWPEAENDNK